MRSMVEADGNGDGISVRFFFIVFGVVVAEIQHGTIRHQIQPSNQRSSDSGEPRASNPRPGPPMSLLLWCWCVVADSDPNKYIVSMYNHVVCAKMVVFRENILDRFIFDVYWGNFDN